MSLLCCVFISPSENRFQCTKKKTKKNWNNIIWPLFPCGAFSLAGSSHPTMKRIFAGNCGEPTSDSVLPKCRKAVKTNAQELQHKRTRIDRSRLRMDLCDLRWRRQLHENGIRRLFFRRLHWHKEMSLFVASQEDIQMNFHWPNSCFSFISKTTTDIVATDILHSTLLSNNNFPNELWKICISLKVSLIRFRCRTPTDCSHLYAHFIHVICYNPRF